MVVLVSLLPAELGFHTKVLLKALSSLSIIIFYLLVCQGIQGCSNRALAPILSKNISVETSVPIYRRGVRIKPDQYVIQRGDSLHGIAWRFGIDYRDLVSWNKISNSDLIYEGQLLIMKGSEKKRVQRAIGGDAKVLHYGKNTIPVTGVDWFWPASGSTQIVREGPKISGLEILGEIGSPIKSAAKGTVVYSGDGLKGYGELIIIKHDEAFLSAYAHSKERLVHEGEKVDARQLIARMGSTGSDSTMLYFEIRRNGKAVNPKLYLPN